MAKIGLELGEKVQIADKTYRDFTPALDMSAVLGTLTWRRYEGAEQYTEEDTTKTPDRFGNYPELPTGEVKWNDIQLYSSAQELPIFVSIVDMPAHAIEDLAFKLGEEVELENPVLTWSNVSGGVYKLFASSIKKKGTQPTPQPPKQDSKKENK